jgi:uncharacterized protein
MPIIVNLRHLESDDVHLDGELAAKELDIESKDEVIAVNQPLKFDLQIQQLEGAILATGRLDLTLDCQCVRCLKSFQYQFELPSWAAHIPLEGEDAVLVTNDCVDLTPFVREDILLEFPQHPLCDPECRGLPETMTGKPKSTSGAGIEGDSSAWAELNKLKL